MRVLKMTFKLGAERWIGVWRRGRVLGTGKTTYTYTDLEELCI